VTGAVAATVTMVIGSLPRASGKEPELEVLHRPLLRVPAAASSGARLPITVDLAHPMEPDHHITAIEVVDARDPVPVKGVFHFTSGNGRAYVAFQARVDEGRSTVTATAHCGRHGRFTTAAPVTIAAGGGGCVGVAPPLRASDDDIRGPIIRIPQLVADGAIRRGEIIDLQVKMKHPSRTGLALRGGRFVQEEAPFHLTEMEVVYDGERVSRFVLTPALSDSPMITCRVLARRPSDVRVTLTNTRGQRFTATHPLRPL
jgi:sulfur-oxidizing protein SoxY